MEHRLRSKRLPTGVSARQPNYLSVTRRVRGRLLKVNGTKCPGGVLYQNCPRLALRTFMCACPCRSRFLSEILSICVS